MSGIRVLVGTKKGAFVLTADGHRSEWEVEGPHFPGWEIYDVAGSPVEPDRIYASQSNGWFGQIIQRSENGGRDWTPVGNDFHYKGEPATHKYYDGSAVPWKFQRVWTFAADSQDPDTVLAGVEDAALFRSSDGGESWAELSGLRTHESSEGWAPGAGGLCLHTILPHSEDRDRMLVAISAAGVFSTDDGGRSWVASNAGLRSEFMPEPEAPVGHCVHKLASHPQRPDVVFMQKHWDVMRSDDGARSWREIGGNLPSDFGFTIGVHAHEPDTVYVVPITSDEQHFPPDGRLRVYRSRTGGDEWEPLTNGLPQANCYVNVLRDAMAFDVMDPCGIYIGTTGGQVYVSADSGDHFEPIVRDLPPVLSVNVQTLS